MKRSGRLAAAATLTSPPDEPVKWLADENLRNGIIRGILRRSPAFDIVRVQDESQISGQDDRAILRFETIENRVVVTHDLATMVPAMREQLRLTSQCAPIVFIPDGMAIGLVTEELLLLDECATEADWAAGVLYLPLR